jgi:hypothetical protein
MAHGALGSQGVRVGRCSQGMRAGCLVLVSDLEDRSGAVTAWLVEYNGASCDLDEYETTVEHPDALERLLAADGVTWLPDDESTLALADALWPRRLRSRGIRRLLRGTRRAGGEN